MNEEVTQAPSTRELKKADPGKRVIAFLIDGVLAGIVSAIPVVGGLIGALYMLLRDALPVEALDHKSVGKKLVGLAVVPEGNPGARIGYVVSAKRNWMWAIGPVLAIPAHIPFIGLLLIPIYAILSLALFVLAVVETLKIFNDPQGKRIGDTMAGTMVIEVTQKVA